MARYHGQPCSGVSSRRPRASVDVVLSSWTGTAAGDGGIKCGLPWAGKFAGLARLFLVNKTTRRGWWGSNALCCRRREPARTGTQGNRGITTMYLTKKGREGMTRRGARQLVNDTGRVGVGRIVTIVFGAGPIANELSGGRWFAWGFRDASCFVFRLQFPPHSFRAARAHGARMSVRQTAEAPGHTPLQHTMPTRGGDYHAMPWESTPSQAKARFRCPRTRNQGDFLAASAECVWV